MYFRGVIPILAVVSVVSLSLYARDYVYIPRIIGITPNKYMKLFEKHEMTVKTTAELGGNVIWRDIRDSLYYEVSNTGLVRNKRTKRVLVPTWNGKGALKVILAEDGENKSVSVARLVGDHFIEGYEAGHVIFYLDDDHGNVDATNLQWKPRWFVQEWSYQMNRERPMRPWPIKMNVSNEVFKNSLVCAFATYGIEKYIVLACIQGNTFYNGSTYEWIKE
jgi:hypothetical protein